MDKAASAGHSDRCRIVVDTCCDFSPEVAANLDVDILGFPFIIDGEERTDDIWSSMSPKEFYDRMRAGARVSTSAVSLGRYIEFFTECAKEGTPTVYLCFTSALSSSYNSACQAADAVRAEYPNFELYVVDNALPCATGELLALEAVRQRSAGLTAKQLVEWANEAKTYVHGYFTLESFDALAAGGRIPPAAAQLTAKLDVKPELSYDLAGSLSLIGVNRGRKKALKSILKSFRENYVPDRTMPIAIMTADAEKDGDWLEAAIRKAAPTSPSSAAPWAPPSARTWVPAWWLARFGARTALRRPRFPIASRVAYVASRQALRPQAPPSHGPNAGAEYSTW